MSNLILQQTNMPLLPATLAQALAQLGAGPGRGGAPRGTVRGQVLRLALDLSLDDAACTAFTLDFVAQGARVRGAARGPSADLLGWALHALAARLGCGLVDADEGAPIVPRPEAHREAAVAYLEAYEAEVRAARQAPGAEAEGGAAFLAWLAREEHVALADGSAELGAALPMDDASALYEMLLDSDAVEEVFVGESELATLLSRFRARRPVTR